MYPSANYLLFLNYEEFVEEIRELAETHEQADQPTWFYSGYDCDSLALEPITGFADYFVDAFKNIPNSVLELRTKSTQVRSLLKKEAQDNVVVAFSLNPDEVISAYEAGTPKLGKRLDAISALQEQGWRVAVRFDPMIWHEGYQKNYFDMYQQVIEKINFKIVDSVSIGGFRLPKDYYKRMQSLFPDDPLFAAGLTQTQDKMIAYEEAIEREALAFLENLLSSDIESNKIHCYPMHATKAVPVPTV
jgi:spore photoproduct lyase